MFQPGANTNKPGAPLVSAFYSVHSLNVHYNVFGSIIHIIHCVLNHSALFDAPAMKSLRVWRSVAHLLLKDSRQSSSVHFFQVFFSSTLTFRILCFTVYLIFTPTSEMLERENLNSIVDSIFHNFFADYNSTFKVNSNFFLISL